MPCRPAPSNAPLHNGVAKCDCNDAGQARQGEEKMNWENMPRGLISDSGEAEQMRQTRGRSGTQRHRDGPGLKKGG